MMKQLYKRILDTLHRNFNMVSFCRSSGMKVGIGTRISSAVNIGSEPYLTEIGDHCEITTEVALINHDGGVWVFREKHPQWDLMGKIIIEDNVYIGYGAMILPNVRIGRNSVIGARSVVTKDIPSGSVAVGVPAKVIKTTDEYYAKCCSSAIMSKGLSGEEKRRFIGASLG
jgi:acetyltransferase-like isoleucine patch superfamily enzyme